MSEFPPKTVGLIRLVANVDSLDGEWPDPHKYNPACFEINVRQDAYRRGQGIPWRIGGDAATRKEGERVLADLAQDGLIYLHKSTGQHRRVGLTDTGDDMARGLLGFWRASESWNVFVGLCEAVKRGPGRWATARDIAEGLGSDVVEAEAWAMLLPLLARGYVVSSVSSVSLETIFTVRSERLELAAGPRPELLADPEPDQRFNEIYWREFDQAEADKTNWRPRRENCVFCPTLK